MHPLKTQHTLIALLAGSLVTLATAPYNMPSLAIIATVILLGLWQHSTPSAAWWYGLSYGCGLFITGISWIFISVHDYGDVATIPALGLTAALVLYLALFPALQGYLLARYWPRTTTSKLILASPALTVLCECLRNHCLTGFPWLNLGYTQVNTILGSWAPLLGVYGVSLVICIISGLIVTALNQGHHYRILASYVALLGLLYSSTYWLNRQSWTQPSQERYAVSLVQASIPQNLKWQDTQIIPTINTYLALTKPYWGNRLIIWPEAAIPLATKQCQSLLSTLRRQALASHSTLITGIPECNDGRCYNAIITLGPQYQVYRKQHLVPFGEYLPGGPYLAKLFSVLPIPMPDLAPGPTTNNAVLELNKHLRMQALICYEIAFAEQVRAQTVNSNAILTLSNDAWFGYSIAAAQHLQIAQMRSLELGKPGLFVSNTGITAMIDSHGNVSNSAPIWRPYVLNDYLVPYDGHTPWQTWGMYLISCLVIAMLALSLIRQ